MPQNYTPIDDLVKKHHQKTEPVSKPKEAEPVPYAKEIELKEVVEHKAEEEVRPYVQPRAETIVLPPDLKKMGLQATTTTQFPTYQNIKLPISDDKVVVALHAPITSSIRWLATLAVYILKQAHLSLRVIHGKVVRIFRR